MTIGYQKRFYVEVWHEANHRWFRHTGMMQYTSAFVTMEQYHRTHNVCVRVCYLDDEDGRWRIIAYQLAKKSEKCDWQRDGF